MLSDNEWTKGFKIFAEDLRIKWFSNSAKDNFFLLGVFSGDVPQTFMISPIHMKKFVQMLQYNVDLYEKEHGKIPVKWKPLVKSPYQAEDLGGPRPL